MRLELMSFSWKTEDRKCCPWAVKTWTNMGNDVFTPGVCHSSNNTVVSKSGLTWFYKLPIQLCVVTFL